MEEKLAYEYELFFRKSLCESRSSLFNSAEEIAVKKMIFQIFREKNIKDDMSEVEENYPDDILDQVCVYAFSYHREEFKKLIQTIVSEWEAKTKTKKNSA